MKTYHVTLTGELLINASSDEEIESELEQFMNQEMFNASAIVKETSQGLDYSPIDWVYSIHYTTEGESK